MNFTDACDILNLKIIFTERELKHNYYTKALKYHPDKNLDIDTKKRFQEILDAYQFLKENKNIQEDIEYTEDNDEHSYMNILNQFINGIVDKNIDVTRFLSIVNNKYSELSCEILKQFPKQVLLRLHKFTSLYAEALHINKEIIIQLDNLIQEHTKDDILMILNPTIDNLLNDEVYKLVYKDETYYVPLWHHELVYELSNNYLIIECEPKLPSHITLDQHNNIYMNVTLSIKKILKEKNITINIGNRTYYIPINELYIKKYQRYIIKQTGISQIDTSNIYNVDYRTNIYIDIHFYDV